MIGKIIMFKISTTKVIMEKLMIIELIMAKPTKNCGKITMTKLIMVQLTIFK
jgi:hypothetical protein